MGSQEFSYATCTPGYGFLLAISAMRWHAQNNCKNQQILQSSWWSPKRQNRTDQKKQYVCVDMIRGTDTN